MLKNRPWFDHYAKVPHSLDYPNVTMYEAVMKSAKRVPDKIAWDFMGTLCTYNKFAEAICLCTDGLASLGLKKGDTITISMPTSPQGIICFYAANKLGAVVSMIHPLSTENEIEFYLNISNSSVALTLDASLNKNKDFQTADLDCLKAAFCGADTLPGVVKEEFEAIVRSRGGNVKLLEGYGLTEAVTAIMAMPMDTYRENSIEVPFSDMNAKIVIQDTTKEAPLGEDGEICLSGPAVMKGYLNQKEETDKTLKIHGDGQIWLHTGDIASQDENGFFYFKLRQKRMIKSSGMNVYPAQVEDVLYRHPHVADACVIGVPDKEQVERVKAFVVLKEGAFPDAAMEKDLITHCQKNLIKWSCPRTIEFRLTLPTTLVGKVAFKTLEDQELENLRQRGEYTGDH